jgi:hypothetical protein
MARSASMSAIPKCYFPGQDRGWAVGRRRLKCYGKPQLAWSCETLACGSVAPLRIEPACWRAMVGRGPRCRGGFTPPFGEVNSPLPQQIDLPPKFPRASSREGKRQQADALQSFASTPDGKSKRSASDLRLLRSAALTEPRAFESVGRRPFCRFVVLAK